MVHGEWDGSAAPFIMHPAHGLLRLMRNEGDQGAQRVVDRL